jgi:hypothetical protein
LPTNERHLRTTWATKLPVRTNAAADAAKARTATAPITIGVFDAGCCTGACDCTSTPAGPVCDEAFGFRIRAAHVDDHQRRRRDVGL